MRGVNRKLSSVFIFLLLLQNTVTIVNQQQAVLLDYLAEDEPFIEKTLLSFRGLAKNKDELYDIMKGVANIGKNIQESSKEASKIAKKMMELQLKAISELKAKQEQITSSKIQQGVSLENQRLLYKRLINERSQKRKSLSMIEESINMLKAGRDLREKTLTKQLNELKKGSGMTKEIIGILDKVFKQNSGTQLIETSQKEILDLTKKLDNQLEDGEEFLEIKAGVATLKNHAVGNKNEPGALKAVEKVLKEVLERLETEINEIEKEIYNGKQNDDKEIDNLKKDLGIHSQNLNRIIKEMAGIKKEIDSLGLVVKKLEKDCSEIEQEINQEVQILQMRKRTIDIENKRVLGQMATVDSCVAKLKKLASS